MISSIWAIRSGSGTFESAIAIATPSLALEEALPRLGGSFASPVQALQSYQFQ
jgi:hypothetical protein